MHVAFDHSLSLEALWTAEGPLAWSHALAILHDPAEADDALQEAFLRVWQARERLDDPTRLAGYLRRCIRNIALDRLRRRRVGAEARAALAARARILRAVGSAPGIDPEQLERALGGLPVEQREVIVLRVWGALDFAGIAARVEAPLGTVHSRYRLGMERLRRALAGEEGP